MTFFYQAINTSFYRFTDHLIRSIHSGIPDTCSFFFRRNKRTILSPQICPGIRCTTIKSNDIFQFMIIFFRILQAIHQRLLLSEFLLLLQFQDLPERVPFYIQLPAHCTELPQHRFHPQQLNLLDLQ